jgi:hypothetical protein
VARTADDVYDDPTVGDEFHFHDTGDVWRVTLVGADRVWFTTTGFWLGPPHLTRAEWAERPDGLRSACTATPAPLTLEGEQPPLPGDPTGG